MDKAKADMDKAKTEHKAELEAASAAAASTASAKGHAAQPRLRRTPLPPRLMQRGENCPEEGLREG